MAKHSEDILYSMRGAELIKLADKLGVKVSCNKTRTALKESKDKVVEKILKAEAALPEVEEKPEKPKAKKTPRPEQKEFELGDKKVEPLKPSRGALIEFDGESKNICAWAEELGISANTLYGRLYRMGWTVERAFTTPGKKK